MPPTTLNMFSRKAQLEVQIHFEDEDKRAFKNTGEEKDSEMALPIYENDEEIVGNVLILPKRGNYDHNGIRVQLSCNIERTFYGHERTEIIEQSVDVARKGILSKQQRFPFSFSATKITSETYKGVNFQIKYIVKVILEKTVTDQIFQREIIILTKPKEMLSSPSIVLEGTSQGIIHAEFLCQRSTFDVDDVIEGVMVFKTLGVKLNSAYIKLTRCEFSDKGSNMFEDVQTLGCWEVMDGTPFCAQPIPVRIYLRHLDLSPTMNSSTCNVHVKYFIHMEVIDEENRCYLRKQEILIIRAIKSPDHKVLGAQKREWNLNSPMKSRFISEKSISQDMTEDDALSSSSVVESSDGYLRRQSQGTDDSTEPPTIEAESIKRASQDLSTVPL